MEQSNSDHNQEEYNHSASSVSGPLLNGCADPGLVSRRILYTGTQMLAIG